MSANLISAAWSALIAEILLVAVCALLVCGVLISTVIRRKKGKSSCCGCCKGCSGCGGRQKHDTD